MEEDEEDVGFGGIEVEDEGSEDLVVCRRDIKFV